MLPVFDPAFELILLHRRLQHVRNDNRNHNGNGRNNNGNNRRHN